MRRLRYICDGEEGRAERCGSTGEYLDVFGAVAVEGEVARERGAGGGGVRLDGGDPLTAWFRRDSVDMSGTDDFGLREKVAGYVEITSLPWTKVRGRGLGRS